MAEINLIRHGQASFGSDNYDRLSEMGHKQALLLGQHFKSLNQQFDHVFCGTMLRHQQTLDGIMAGLDCTLPTTHLDNFNEYNFSGLLGKLQRQFNDEWVDTGNAAADYYQNMKRALNYWATGHIDTDSEDSWIQFCERTLGGFKQASEYGEKRILLVSSGGPIALMLAQILGVSDSKAINICLQIKNSSTQKVLHRPRADGREFTLDSYNDVSHLANTEHQQLISFS